MNAVEKEVLAIHDEVMPKMSDIARLSEILESESVNPHLDSAQHMMALATLEHLESADSLMWDWMHNYNKPEDASLDSILDYLQHEKDRVSAMRDAMLQSISRAEQVVQKLGHAQPN